VRLSGSVTKILVVEDNEISRAILSRRLEKRGFAVIQACDGGEGIALASREKPDLILMDMSLPGIDGWHATRELRKLPETTGIPVIALTAHTLPGDRDRAIEAGCDEYEGKPVELPQLMSKIESLLSRGSRNMD
jgi:two-component system cell cycle response regulator DivK